MENRTIIGTDVSKLTLDCAIKAQRAHCKVENNQKGFKRWLEWALLFTDKKQLWVVMEHTGYYSYQFELFLAAQSITYSKIPALEIKRSTGLLRGKNDKADAMMISEYGWLRQTKLKAMKGPLVTITRLKDLISLREKLVADRSGYKARIKEQMATRKYKASNIQNKIQLNIIQNLTHNIKMADKEILQLIKSDNELLKNYMLLISIKGIGPVTATYMVAYTDNFTKFDNSRKFSCYAGLAPFDHSSGTSIKGRKRVSHYANKRAKSLLNLSALTAVRFNPELKNYYQRRVTEGKNKMSVLNIIRNKLVDRIFAVVKRQTPYLDRIPQTT